MISDNILLELKKDFVLFSIFLVIANIIQSKMLDTPMFDSTWINLVIGTFIGVTIYNIFLYHVPKVIVNKINNRDCFDSIDDLIKYITIFISQYIFVVIITGEFCDFNKEWIVTSSITLACYILFVFIEHKIPKINKDQKLLNNLIKISLAVLIYSYFIKGPINDNPLLAIFPLYIAYGIIYFGASYYNYTEFSKFNLEKI